MDLKSVVAQIKSGKISERIFIFVPILTKDQLTDFEFESEEKWFLTVNQV